MILESHKKFSFYFISNQRHLCIEKIKDEPTLKYILSRTGYIGVIIELQNASTIAAKPQLELLVLYHNVKKYTSPDGDSLRS